MGSKNFGNAFSKVTEGKREADKAKITELQKQLNENKKPTKILLDEIVIKPNIRQSDYNITDLIKDMGDYGQLVPVLLTKDKILLDGYRRFFTAKQLKLTGLDCHFLNFTYEEIGYRFAEMQYIANESRRNLDNIDLAYFYNIYYEDRNWGIGEIAGFFNKTKGFISKIISLKNIDQGLQELIREFQVFAYSKKKFTAVNNRLKAINKNILENDLFYSQNRNTFIGVNQLYKIAKEKDSLEQQKVFYELFKNRLSDEEKNDFIEDLEIDINQETKKENTEINKVFKVIKDQAKNYSKEKQKLINKKLKELREIMENKE